MKRFSNNIISIVLVLMMLVSGTFSSFAQTQTLPQLGSGKNVVIDGIEYNVRIDEEMNIHVQTVDAENQATMIIDSNGEGIITEVIDGEYEEYIVKINELHEDDVDVEIRSMDDDILIQTYSSMSDLKEPEYSTRAVGSIVIGAGLLDALIAALLAVVILGVTWVAVTEIESQLEENKKYYYPAEVMYDSVYITRDPISKLKAADRLRAGKSVYTYLDDMARNLAYSTGDGVIGPENHYGRTKPGLFFDHYHTKRKGEHSFFGVPQRRALKAE